MSRRFPFPVLAPLVLVLLCPAALAQGGPASPPMAGGAADREMMSGMAAMQRDMGAAPMTGDPDHDFAAMMIPHHRGAIAMARIELRDGRDPRMRALATRIIADQDREIALMRDWLAAHAGPAASSR